MHAHLTAALAAAHHATTSGYSTSGWVVIGALAVLVAATLFIPSSHTIAIGRRNSDLPADE